ncbi:MAG: (3R)-hydroxyacyl-ACP dehydratase subunit HadC [Mycobacteriaceae bacterium]|nr:(3R)-hydroxyacyl-ACP dehydratase subunit HadC [Mycobacteriaceae bacterium]MBV9639265.1 (3R)-hydroxyacyl-ACP dehydratase subunit HadC [Mycobacteriaceae bacterium]
MALKTDIRGLVWKYPDHFEVGREQIRSYARAIKVTDRASYDEEAAAELGHDSIVAPLTFMSTFALLIQQHFFRHVDLGLETMQIVQVDQKFIYHKPIQAGDKLYGTMYVHSVDERFGADIVVTRNVCANANGEPVLEAVTTMMGQQGDNSAGIKWDRESGQVIRVAVGD